MFYVTQVYNCNKCPDISFKCKENEVKKKKQEKGKNKKHKKLKQIILLAIMQINKWQQRNLKIVMFLLSNKTQYVRVIIFWVYFFIYELG